MSVTISGMYSSMSLRNPNKIHILLKVLNRSSTDKLLFDDLFVEENINKKALKLWTNSFTKVTSATTTRLFHTRWPQKLMDFNFVFRIYSLTSNTLHFTHKCYYYIYDDHISPRGSGIHPTDAQHPWFHCKLIFTLLAQSSSVGIADITAPTVSYQTLFHSFTVCWNILVNLEWIRTGVGHQLDASFNAF